MLDCSPFVGELIGYMIDGEGLFLKRYPIYLEIRDGTLNTHLVIYDNEIVQATLEIDKLYTAFVISDMNSFYNMKAKCIECSMSFLFMHIDYRSSLHAIVLERLQQGKGVCILQLSNVAFNTCVIHHMVSHLLDLIACSTN